jgi:hypothetical protein
MTWTAEELLKIIFEASPQDCITEQRLVEMTGKQPINVEMAVLRLRKHGLVERTGQDCHKLTDAGRAAAKAGMQIRSGPKAKWTAPKINRETLRVRVWRAIRIRRKFSIPDLEMLVAEGGEKDIACNIRKYLNALERAGYLTRLKVRQRGTSLTSNGYVRWWLMDQMDTGPLAPVWRHKSETVYDPNNETEISIGRKEAA